MSNRRTVDGRLRTAALFTVVGDGCFPFDMLRYDACWPHGEQDAFAVTADYDAVRRRVVLETHRVEAAYGGAVGKLRLARGRHGRSA